MAKMADFLAKHTIVAVVVQIIAIVAVAWLIALAASFILPPDTI